MHFHELLAIDQIPVSHYSRASKLSGHSLTVSPLGQSHPKTVCVGPAEWMSRHPIVHHTLVLCHSPLDNARHYPPGFVSTDAHSDCGPCYRMLGHLATLRHIHVVDVWGSPIHLWRCIFHR